MNSQRTKRLFAHEVNWEVKVNREVKSMPILLYIAMWSCALGMASSLTPRLVRDSQDRE